MKSELVTVMKFTKLYPTRYVKEKLQSEEIECVLSDEGFQSEDEELPHGWNLKVWSEDVEKTVKVLLEIQKDLGLENIDELNTLKDQKKILVPVDLSNYSTEVIKYAFGMAEKIKAEIKFMYVLEEPHMSGAVKYTTSWEKHEKIEKDELYRNAQFMLEDFSIKIKDIISEELLKTTPFHFAIHTGILGNTVVSLSYRYKPDLILMSHKISTEDKKEHLSKVVHHIVEHSQYPVLVLPRSVKYSRPEMLNVLYATDFHDNDHRSLNTLISILKPFDTNIHCIHIECDYKKNTDERIKELNQFLKDEYKDYKIQAEVYECNNVSMGIEEFVENNKIDLISMSNERHNFIYKIFHSDVLGEMIKANKVPILVFPDA